MYFYRIKFLVILFANFFKSLQGRQNKRNWKRTLQVNMLIIWDIFYNDHFLYLFCIDCTNMHTCTSLHTPKFSKSYGIFTQLLNIIQQSKIQTCQQHRWNYNDYILNWHTRRFSQFNFYLKLIIAKHLYIWIYELELLSCLVWLVLLMIIIKICGDLENIWSCKYNKKRNG